MPKNHEFRLILFVQILIHVYCTLVKNISDTNKIVVAKVDRMERQRQDPIGRPRGDRYFKTRRQIK